ncbi:MAG TPA: T9SS type A sorting domain-containing protein [Bacteroidia bacterium]|nr:T9SS type A sorting domain-containing protein [Bacteroidia bacterium]
MKKYLTAALGFLTVCTFAQAPVFSNEQHIARCKHNGGDSTDLAELMQKRQTQVPMLPLRLNPPPGAPATAGNPGFENGDFTAWTGFIGDNHNSSSAPLSNLQAGIFSTLMDAPITDWNARHTIMSAAGGNDYYGGFPAVPAALGNYTARLGNDYANYQGEILEQTWLVDPGQPFVIISYAVVLRDYGHPQIDRAYFNYVLLDANQNPIAIRNLFGPDTTFMLSTVSNGDPVYYLPWKSDTIPLSSFIGTNITIRFTVAGCTFAGHFGYCYVDVFYPYITGSTEQIQAEFSLYPNPTTGVLDLQFPDTTGKYQVSITNTVGQLIRSFSVDAITHLQIDLTGEAEGVYLVTVQSSAGVSVKRVVLQ